jgi:hypothetical protein
VAPTLQQFSLLVGVSGAAYLRAPFGVAPGVVYSLSLLFIAEDDDMDDSDDEETHAEMQEGFDEIEDADRRSSTSNRSSTSIGVRSTSTSKYTLRRFSKTL